jgi:hypothetical protein
MYIVYESSDLWYQDAMSTAVPIFGQDDLTNTPESGTIKKVGGLRPPGTCHILTGTRIVGGPDQEVDSSGTPITETWTFIAENIDTLGSKTITSTT